MSEDWLKYAIQLNLLHKDKNDLVELKNQVISCEKIREFSQYFSE